MGAASWQEGLQVGKRDGGGEYGAHPVGSSAAAPSKLQTLGFSFNTYLLSAHMCKHCAGAEEIDKTDQPSVLTVLIFQQEQVIFLVGTVG